MPIRRAPFTLLAYIIALCAPYHLWAERDFMTFPDRADRYHIVLPAKPSATESFAAAELQRYLSRTFTGGQPSIGEAEREGRIPVFVGRFPANTAVRPQSVEASHRDDDVYSVQLLTMLVDPGDRASGKRLGFALFGASDRGTLYAVYDFLEQLGWRFIGPGPDGAYLIPNISREIPNLSRTVSPPIAARSIGTSGPWPDPVNLEPEKVVQTVDWLAKNRLNKSFALRPQRLYNVMPADQRDVWSKRGGMVNWQHIAHNTTFMVPNETYFKTHPEYYSLYHGQRLPIGPEGGYLCTTNLEVIRLVADYAADWFNKNPDGTVFPIIPPDGAIKWCECERCMSLGGKNFATGADKSMTRRQVTFVNEVAKIVRKTHPDRYLLNLAYSQYVEPYPGLKTEPNVIVQLAHGYAGHGSFVRPIREDVNAEARAFFEQWAGSGGGGIGLWDYFMLHVPQIGGSPKTPLGLAYVAQDMMTYLAELPGDYKVYFTQAGNELWVYNSFLYYAVAQLAWKPNTPLETLYTDFARAVFGAAWEPAAAYLRALDDAYRQATDWTPKYWGHITVPSPIVFTEDVMATLDGHLTALEATVPADDTRARDMLGRWRTSYHYVASTVGPKRLLGDDGVWQLDRGEDAYTFNAGPGAPTQQQIDAVRLYAMQHDLMDDAMRRLLYRCTPRAETIHWLEDDRIRVGVLPGVGGRIIRIIDKRTGVNLLHEPELSTLEDPGVGYFNYGGYEEYTQKIFASFGWEVPMSIATRDAGRTLVLSGRYDDLFIERTITIETKGGDGPSDLLISTTLENLGQKPRPSMIRVHPVFSLGGDLNALHWLYQKDATAPALSALPLLHVADAASYQPAGYWGAVNAGLQLAVMQRFDASDVHTHLHVDRAGSSFNLELFGPETQLAPDATTTLSHRYSIYSGQASIDLLRLDLPAPPAPAPPAAEYQPGLVGQAVRLPESPLRLPNLQAALSESGSIEFAVQIPADLDPDVPYILASMGTRQPDWLGIALHEGELSALRSQGHAPYDGADERYLRVSSHGADFAPGSWHQVVLAWSGAGSDDGRFTLYLDGASVDARTGAIMLPFRFAPDLLIGRNAASHDAPMYPGAFDAIRVLDRPMTAAEVAASYAALREGQAPPALDGTRVRLNLDGDLAPAGD